MMSMVMPQKWRKPMRSTRVSRTVTRTRRQRRRLPRRRGVTMVTVSRTRPRFLENKIKMKILATTSRTPNRWSRQSPRVHMSRSGWTLKAVPSLSRPTRLCAGLAGVRAARRISDKWLCILWPGFVGQASRTPGDFQTWNPAWTGIPVRRRGRMRCCGQSPSSWSPARWCSQKQAWPQAQSTSSQNSWYVPPHPQAASAQYGDEPRMPDGKSPRLQCTPAEAFAGQRWPSAVQCEAMT